MLSQQQHSNWQTWINNIPLLVRSGSLWAANGFEKVMGSTLSWLHGMEGQTPKWLTEKSQNVMRLHLVTQEYERLKSNAAASSGPPFTKAQYDQLVLYWDGLLGKGPKQNRGLSDLYRMGITDDEIDRCRDAQQARRQKIGDSSQSQEAWVEEMKKIVEERGVEGMSSAPGFIPRLPEQAPIYGRALPEPEPLLPALKSASIFEYDIRKPIDIAKFRYPDRQG